MDYPDFPPKHPLSDAIHQVMDGILAAYRHLNDREGKLTEQDMHLFERLRETVWIQYFHTAHILYDARRTFAKQSEVPPERPAGQKH